MKGTNYNSNCSCQTPIFSAQLRTEFTVYTNEINVICTLLKSIGSLNVNISAYDLITTSSNQIIFRFIPGVDIAQSIPAVNAVRCLLQNSKLKYSENEVVVSTIQKRMPGTFAIALCELSENIDIYYSYVTETGSQIFQTSSNIEAIKILNQIYVSPK